VSVVIIYGVLAQYRFYCRDSKTLSCR